MRKSVNPFAQQLWYGLNIKGIERPSKGCWPVFYPLKSSLLQVFYRGRIRHIQRLFISRNIIAGSDSFSQISVATKESNVLDALVSAAVCFFSCVSLWLCLASDNGSPLLRSNPRATGLCERLRFPLHFGCSALQCAAFYRRRLLLLGVFVGRRLLQP